MNRRACPAASRMARPFSDTPHSPFFAFSFPNNVPKNDNAIRGGINSGFKPSSPRLVERLEMIRLPRLHCPLTTLEKLSLFGLGKNMPNDTANQTLFPHPGK